MTKKDWDRERRRDLSKFYYVLAQTMFAVLVVGGLIPIAKGEDLNAWGTIMAIGAAGTAGFAYVAYKTSKY